MARILNLSLALVTVFFLSTVLVGGVWVGVASAGGIVVAKKKAAGGGGYATPAYVQSNSGYSNGPATLGSNATAGNLIAVFVSGNAAVASTMSGGGVSSWSSGTAYLAANFATGGRWYYGITSGGSVSVTINSPPADAGWSIYEISGVDSTPLDQQNGTENYSVTSWTSGNVTTTLANEVLLGGWANEQNYRTPVWDSGWEHTTVQNGHYHGTAMRVVSSTGTYAASGTQNTNTDAMLVIILALKAKAL